MDDKKKILVKVRAIILYEGKMLVVKHPHDTSFAALPGGHLEWGEDVKECLARELVEELGVKTEIGRLLYINTFTQEDGKHYLELFFEVLEGEKYLDIANLERTHSHEIAELLWVSPKDDVKIRPKSFAEDFENGKILSDQTRFIKN